PGVQTCALPIYISSLSARWPPMGPTVPRIAPGRNLVPTSTITHPATASPELPVRNRDRRGIVLAVVLCAQLMIVLDLTVVNIALPSIARGLHFSAPSLAWVLIAYSLTFGGLLLFGCRAVCILALWCIFVV